MSTDQNIRRSHRICPCNPMDIEGIQSWLEDLAAQGFLLESESVFCGFWSFVHTEPRQAQYRLEVVRGNIMDDTDTPKAEVVETAEAMGWEYITKYRAFYIYRSFDPHARPFHTDPAVQALTIKTLRRQQYTDLIFDLLYIFVVCFFRNSYFGYLFRDSVNIGVFYTLCTLLLFLYLLLRPVLHITTLRKAIQRLKKSKFLDRKRNWARRRPWWLAWRILPLCIAVAFLSGLLIPLYNGTNRQSQEFFAGSTPFAVIDEVYPYGTVTNRSDMGDYNTFSCWRTGVSENIDWAESGNITVDGQNYHFILRATSHETINEWIAKGLVKDYLANDRTRYHGKHFEMLEAPETDADDLWVYSSYGIRYVLLRQGCTVVHATVSIDLGQDTDLWEQWLYATIDKLSIN